MIKISLIKMNSDVILRKKVNKDVQQDKIRRHTLMAFDNDDVKEKLENYKRLLEKENEIRNKLDRAKSELELSLPLSQESFYDFYSSTLPRNYSKSSKNRLSLQLSLFSSIMEDAAPSTIATEKKYHQRNKTDPLAAKKQVQQCNSLSANVYSGSMETNKRQMFKHSQILDTRRAEAKQKAEKRRACLKALEDDLMKAKYVIKESQKVPRVI